VGESLSNLIYDTPTLQTWSLLLLATAIELSRQRPSGCLRLWWIIEQPQGCISTKMSTVHSYIIYRFAHNFLKQLKEFLPWKTTNYR